MKEQLLNHLKPKTMKEEQGISLQKELNTLVLLSQFSLGEFDYEKIQDYVVQKIKAGDVVELENARFTSEVGEQKEVGVSDVFEINLEGYWYHGVIQYIGECEEKHAYRLLVIQEGCRPIICNHKGLGKLFDYCEDYQAVFFVDCVETNPFKHLMALIEKAEALEELAYGYFDFDGPVELTRVEVEQNNVSVLSAPSEMLEDRSTFRQVVGDILYLDHIIERNFAEDFDEVMAMIDYYEADGLFDYEGIRPVCGCEVTEFIEQAEKTDNPEFIYDMVFTDFYDVLLGGYLDEKNVVEHAFYFNTYLQLQPITTEEVKALAEALKTYLKWYYEVDVIRLEEKIA